MPVRKFTNINSKKETERYMSVHEFTKKILPRKRNNNMS